MAPDAGLKLPATTRASSSTGQFPTALEKHIAPLLEG